MFVFYKIWIFVFKRNFKFEDSLVRFRDCFKNNFYGYCFWFCGIVCDILSYFVVIICK